MGNIPLNFSPETIMALAKSLASALLGAAGGNGLKL
jgi:hypothetical protein